VAVLITGSAIRTCLGDGESTFAALLQGKSGISPLSYFHPEKLNVNAGYQIVEAEEEQWFRAGRWLADCVREALAQAKVDPARMRVAAIVGTGLRELRAVERWALNEGPLPIERMHFSSAIREVSPHIQDVITLSNACSASGHALALAQDLIELGEADAVIAAGVDAMTASMLAMIGRFAEAPTECVRPFDTARTGTLLGEGAAALIVMPESSSDHPLARVLSTGLSCDAHHETAPEGDGVRRAMQDAMARAQRGPGQVDLVLAHGTGTLLNEPAEAQFIRDTLCAHGPGPWITAVKGALGHTSGASALMSVDVALRSMKAGLVPPVVGLKNLLAEGQGLRFVMERPAQARLRLAAINAFGFGGVNSITLVEAAA
jgi:3-oxoacyl-[acyl-carrier-protein] synthase II